MFRVEQQGKGNTLTFTNRNSFDVADFMKIGACADSTKFSVFNFKLNVRMFWKKGAPPTPRRGPASAGVPEWPVALAAALAALAPNPPIEPPS